MDKDKFLSDIRKLRNWLDRINTEGMDPISREDLDSIRLLGIDVIVYIDKDEELRVYYKGLKEQIKGLVNDIEEYLEN